MDNRYDTDDLDEDLNTAASIEGNLQFGPSGAASSDEGNAPLSDSDPNSSSDGTYSVDPSLDQLRQPDGSDTPPDDTLEKLGYFTRQDIMRMSFDSAFRLYQAVAVSDGKLAPVDVGINLFRQCLQHTVNGAALCLSDAVMGALFDKAYTDLQHNEDPWFNAIKRELIRIETASNGIAP